MTAFLHGFFEGHGAHGDPGEKISINRNHSRTECKNSLEMSILRSVFERDINSDCIFTGFFEAFEAHEAASRLMGEPRSATYGHCALRS